MGLLTRALVPRSVRRATHPVRTAKSAVTPRVVKQARNVMNPVDSAVYYGIERPLNTKPRKSRKGTTQAQQVEYEYVEQVEANTPEKDRAISRIVLAVAAVVIVAYVVLSLIFGWVPVLLSTIAFAYVAYKIVTIR
jgi:uncharacterized protein YqhQ